MSTVITKDLIEQRQNTQTFVNVNFYKSISNIYCQLYNSHCKTI